MTVAVTGAAGYLGEYVTDELLRRDREVVAFDVDPSAGLRERAEAERALTVVQGDMTSFAEVSNLAHEDALIEIEAEAVVPDGGWETTVVEPGTE